MADHDLLIRAGSVLDGTGAPARTADVAISDGVVIEVGRVDGSAARTIDADGLLVTPGFVDVHTHYDGQATWDQRMIPSVWHGVTTVVTGNCGVGFAPVHDSDRQRLIELMEGVEDIPGAVLDEGLSWKWNSFAEFLDTVDAGTFDVDVAMQVPHGALRLHVMGERGAAREPATPDDIAAMADLAAAAVRAGALGFSTSRTLNHRTSRGEPTPTLTAEADELVGIARAIGATGRGVLQVVSDFRDVDGEFGLFRRMAEESGLPLAFTLVQAPRNGWRRQLELLGEANADGLTITGQVAPRPVGLLLGLQCTLNPFQRTAGYREIVDLPLTERVAAMAVPERRERIVAEAREEAAARTERGLPDPFGQLYVLSDPPVYELGPQDTIAALAQRQGRDVVETAYDHLCADGGRSFFYVPFLNYVDGNLDATGEMLAHPNTVPGLGDGGAHLGTICDASFPTTLLTWWGRDRPHGRLDLAYLVRQQTRDTAASVGLLDRGVLAPGYRADANVIDFEHLAARRPEMRYDLPAGGKRLVQQADGYIATVKAGEVTYENGEAAGPLPGRLLRGARPAPSIGGAR